MFTLNILRLALMYYCIALRNKATPGEGGDDRSQIKD